MSASPTTHVEGIEYAALTDIGLRRTNNQDSLAVVPAASDDLWRERGHLFMVADGMGAHAAGELASKMAVDSVPLVYDKDRELPAPDALRAAVEKANADIHNRGQANAEFHGMGTTATSLVLLPQGALVAHVGDSRAYRLRRGRLEQLSFDHSLAWEMALSAKVSTDEVPGFVPRNVITRSLGPHPEVQVDLEGPFPVESGDVFILCSDGLTGQVKDEEIGAILSCLAPEEAAQSLIDLANLRGGPDNITVIVVRVTDDRYAAGGAGASTESAARRSRSSPPPAAFMIALLVTAALAAVLAAAQLWIFAAVAGLGALASAAFLLFGRNPPTPHQYVATDTVVLGKAPYRLATGAPNEAISQTLAHLVDQLREAATDEGWVVDWQRFSALRDDAHHAAASHDHQTAVRQYCRAASFMMRELRSQNARAARDEA